MSDVYGPVTLPIAASAGAAQVVTLDASDPLLSYLLSYFATAANARLATAWATVDPISAKPVVGTFAEDPNTEGSVFDENKLPALFAWRDGDPVERWLADDWRISDSTISVLWVPPPVPAERWTPRSVFANRIAKLCRALLVADRDRSWVVTGDTDINTPTLGSSFRTLTNVMRCEVASWKRVPLQIRIPPNGDVETYRGALITIEARERVQFDTSIYDAIEGADGTLRTQDAGYGDGGKVTNTFDLTT